MSEKPDRNLALELIRVTEAAALSSARLVGRGDKIAADQAAVDAMRHMLATVDMDGTVIIGEGEKDEAPMLYCGEKIGTGQQPTVDVAVDPLEGTTLTAKGQPNALSVIAVAESGTMFDPGAAMYMEKIAVGADAAHAIDIERPLEDNLESVAIAKGKPVSQLTVVMLDRPRHDEAMQRVRAAGARIRLITDGDVAGVLAAARPNNSIDLLYGIGGTPEGVLAAAGIHCLGGMIQGRLWAKDDEQASSIRDFGHDLSTVITTDDLISGEDIFFAATGVTDGDLLQGVRYTRTAATTESMIMRSRSGTVRIIKSEHNREKLAKYTGGRYFAGAAAVPS